jgi:hypothetical protein
MSLPHTGAPGLRRQFQQRRNVGRQIRRRIRERDAFLERRVGVDHARRNRVVTRREARFERRQRLVHRAFRHEHFGAARPHHHQPVAAMLRLEGADVGDELVGQILLVLPGLHVRAAQPLHVALIEHRRHRPDRFHLGPDLVEQTRLEHAGRAGRGVAVFREDVPAAEDEVVEADEADEVLDARRAVLGALPEPDRAHLRERADRLGQALPDREHAGNGGGGDGAQAHEQDPESASGRRNFYWCFHPENISCRPRAAGPRSGEPAIMAACSSSSSANPQSTRCRSR